MSAGDLNKEFYLVDQKIGYLFNTNGKPRTPPPPTSEAEAIYLSDPANFHPPLYKFEKPPNAPAGLYDLVLIDGTEAVHRHEGKRR